MEDTEKQHKKQYDWLKGYQFVKGQSGNPGGRPKGKSLKTFAREYLETLDDDEKIKFISVLPEDLVWKMAEGNPESKTDITTQGEKININDPKLVEIAKQFEEKLKKENASRSDINPQLDTQ